MRIIGAKHTLAVAGVMSSVVAGLFVVLPTASADPTGHLGDGDASAYAADMGFSTRLEAYKFGHNVCQLHRQGWTPGDVATELNIKVLGLEYAEALVMVRHAEYHFCPEMINWSDPDVGRTIPRS